MTVFSFRPSLFHWVSQLQEASETARRVPFMYTSAVPQYCVARSFNGTAPYHQNVFHMHLQGFSLNYFLRNDPSVLKWGRRTENIPGLTHFVKKLVTWKGGDNLEGKNEKNQESRLSSRRKGREKNRSRGWTECQQTAKHSGTESM
jgi:hypothetical protein